MASTATEGEGDPGKVTTGTRLLCSRAFYLRRSQWIVRGAIVIRSRPVATGSQNHWSLTSKILPLLFMSHFSNHREPSNLDRMVHMRSTCLWGSLELPQRISFPRLRQRRGGRPEDGRDRAGPPRQRPWRLKRHGDYSVRARQTIVRWGIKGWHGTPPRPRNPCCLQYVRLADGARPCAPAQKTADETGLGEDEGVLLNRTIEHDIIIV
jgi:hypothetical protein